MPSEGRGILSPVRLPVPPLQQVLGSSEITRFRYAVCGSQCNLALRLKPPRAPIANRRGGYFKPLAPVAVPAGLDHLHRASSTEKNRVIHCILAYSCCVLTAQLRITKLNRACTLALVAALLTGFGAGAQENPFSTETKQDYESIKSTLLRAADKMPEGDYSFRTVAEVRSYGEILMHIADVQFILCGLAKGEQKQGRPPANSGKAAVTAYLKSSFDYCDNVYNSMSDSEGAAKVKFLGRELTKLGVLNYNTAHDNEMYGTAVAYLRLKRLVPPSIGR
jgi:DinB superfamily